MHWQEEHRRRARHARSRRSRAGSRLDGEIGFGFSIPAANTEEQASKSTKSIHSNSAGSAGEPQNHLENALIDDEKRPNTMWGEAKNSQSKQNPLLNEPRVPYLDEGGLVPEQPKQQIQHEKSKAEADVGRENGVDLPRFVYGPLQAGVLEHAPYPKRLGRDGAEHDAHPEEGYPPVRVAVPALDIGALWNVMCAQEKTSVVWLFPLASGKFSPGKNPVLSLAAGKKFPDAPLGRVSTRRLDLEKKFRRSGNPLEKRRISSAFPDAGKNDRPIHFTLYKNDVNTHHEFRPMRILQISSFQTATGKGSLFRDAGSGKESSSRLETSVFPDKISSHEWKQP